MSSEAITRNDLSAILNEVLPPTPSEYKKLLWSNPSPTSAFSAQTVSLDLSNYDDVEVEFMCWNTEQQEMASVMVAIGASGRMVSPLAVCAFRKFSVTSTSVAFENAQAYPNYGNWALGTQNNACIPYRIYGIKYERIAPPQLEVVPLQVATFQKNTSFAAGAGSVVFDTPLPEGAIIKSRCISQNPNAQWLYCGIHTVSATSTTVAYRNNFSSAFSGTMELSVFYEIAN